MRTYPIRLPRRLLLSLPAVVAAAVTVGVRPAKAKAEAAPPECAADLLGGQ
ncbi:MAG TPA: hypothetical protein VFC19_09190 [Candidatus Limnocylindrales bacterium]|nr:hypothetical protein [Candidatus Limnocylindrales bacterium]